MKAQTVPTLALAVTMLFATGMPVAAQARDWKEYRIMCTDGYGSRVKLERQVNKMMKDGWQPLGGAFGFSFYLCQTMVTD